VKILVPLVAVLALAACATPPPAAAPSPSPSRSLLSFPDPTRSDGDSTVDVLSYDPNAESVVVEPIIFGITPEICKKLNIPVNGERCSSEAWLKEQSNTRYTLPMAKKAVILSMTSADEDEDCLDPEKLRGKCKLDGIELGRQIEGGSKMMTMTTKDGAVTQLAEIYTP
jgi:hypothetical protein